VALFAPYLALLPECRAGRDPGLGGGRPVRRQGLRPSRQDRLGTSSAFALIATAGVIWIGVLQGVFIAVAATLAHLVRLAARPEDDVMGRHPSTGELVTLIAGPMPSFPRNPRLLFKASVLFVNAEYFRERVVEALASRPDTKWLVSTRSAMIYSDSAAVDTWKRSRRSSTARASAC
jgi:MFS superfamily sulfate permease-like transporter